MEEISITCIVVALFGVACVTTSTYQIDQPVTLSCMTDLLVTHTEMCSLTFDPVQVVAMLYGHDFVIRGIIPSTSREEPWLLSNPFSGGFLCRSNL